MPVTIADIAKAAGKSASTVSRVLRGDTTFPVTEASRQRITQIAREMNYVPAHSARSLVTGRSYCVAAVLGSAEKDLSEPSFAPTLLGMTRTFLSHGYHLALLPTSRTNPSDDELLEMVRGRRIDGFYIGSGMLGASALKELKARKTPIVTTELDPQLARIGRVDVVGRDDQPATGELVAELLRRGHRRVAFVAPEYFVRHKQQIYARFLPEFRRLMDEAGVKYDTASDFIYKPTVRGMLASRAEARAAVERDLDRLRRHTAIVANSDLVAFGVADALRTVGLEAGRDYALVGFNNIEQNAAYYVEEPFLTTMDPDFSLRGHKIAELLLRRIADPEAEATTCDIPTRLIVRRSMMNAPTAWSTIREDRCC